MRRAPRRLVKGRHFIQDRRYNQDRRLSQDPPAVKLYCDDDDDDDDDDGASPLGLRLGMQLLLGM